MTYEAELNRIRDRAEAARPAVETVLVRQGGLYADVPIDDPVSLLKLAVASAADVPGLVSEVVRLSPAAYVFADDECMDRECDYWYDDDGQPILRGEDDRCPHIQERVATLGHVKVAEALARLVRSLRRALVDRGEGELVEAIDDTVGVLRRDEDVADVAAVVGLVSAEDAATPQGGGGK